MRRGRFLIIIYFVFLIWLTSDIRNTNLLLADEKSTSYGDTLGLRKKSLILSSANYSYRGQEGDIGLVGSKIKKIVKDVPRALNEIEIFQNYRVNSFFLTLDSVAVMGIGITEIIDDNDQMGISLLTVGSAGLVGGIILDRVGYGHLKKGASEFNNYLKTKADTSEWTEEAIVYYPGSKSEKVARDMSVYGTFLPIATGVIIWVLSEANTTAEPQTGIPLFFIVTGATVGPALGYFYCNEGTRGALGIGIRTGLVILTAVLSEEKGGSKSLKNFDIENEYLLIGTGAILVSIAYDIFKVDDAVRKYNRKFSEQSFRLVPKYFSEVKAVGLGIEMKF